MLATCKTLHQDGIDVLYGGNCFTVYTWAYVPFGKEVFTVPMHCLGSVELVLGRLLPLFDQEFALDQMLEYVGNLSDHLRLKDLTIRSGSSLTEGWDTHHSDYLLRRLSSVSVTRNVTIKQTVPPSSSYYGYVQLPWSDECAAEVEAVIKGISLDLNRR